MFLQHYIDEEVAVHQHSLLSVSAHTLSLDGKVIKCDIA